MMDDKDRRSYVAMRWAFLWVTFPAVGLGFGILAFALGGFFCMGINSSGTIGQWFGGAFMISIIFTIWHWCQWVNWANAPKKWQ